jgi:hypothetical protein
MGAWLSGRASASHAGGRWFDSIRAHQTFIFGSDFPHVAEGRCGYAGSNKPFSVERDPVRKEELCGTAVAVRVTLGPREPRRAAGGPASFPDPHSTWAESLDRHRRARRRGHLARGRDGLRGVPMTERSLQVTYRKGRAFAAYLHLSHPTGEKSARTVASPDGLLTSTTSASGGAVGVEITAPQAVPLERLNQLLAELGEAPLAEQDYKPVRAA